MEFNKMKKMLKEASNIAKKIPINKKTFMDISGYPHLENVYSNILAFYLNPKEEHKLKNLVMVSLVKVINSKNSNLNIEINNINEKIKVQREYPTKKGNRIDLVIQNDNFVIGIENKLYASVYNDLEDYANTLNKLHTKSIKILLSLYKNEKEVENTEFINITYQEFFKQLKEDLNIISDKNNKWYIFIQEFINNLESFEGELEMEDEIISFFKDNKNEIEEFDKMRETAYKCIEKRQDELKALLEDRLKVNYIKIWEGKNDITCYIDSPYKYHVDAKLSTYGWTIGIFTWTTYNSNKIMQILTNSNYEIIEDEANHRWLYEYDYNTPIEEILNKLIEIDKYIEKSLVLDNE